MCGSVCVCVYCLRLRLNEPIELLLKWKVTKYNFEVEVECFHFVVPSLLHIEEGKIVLYLCLSAGCSYWLFFYFNTGVPYHSSSWPESLKMLQIYILNLRDLGYFYYCIPRFFNCFIPNFPQFAIFFQTVRWKIPLLMHSDRSHSFFTFKRTFGWRIFTCDVVSFPL